MTTEKKDKKTLEEKSEDAGVALVKGAKKAGKAVVAFGEGIKKGIEDKNIDEKAEDAGKTVGKDIKKSSRVVREKAGEVRKEVKKDAKKIKKRIK